MIRRLFFLLPDELHAAEFVQELERFDVPRERLHAVAGKGRSLEGLPLATARQRRDTVSGIERWLWKSNLGLFVFAALAMIFTLANGDYLWSVSASIVMLGTFLGGWLFSLRVPDTHLAEFHNALAHGEIVLMVDVPSKRVGEIEDLARRHPEVTPGGVGWTVSTLGF